LSCSCSPAQCFDLSAEDDLDLIDAALAEAEADLLDDAMVGVRKSGPVYFDLGADEDPLVVDDAEEDPWSAL
jgi:hypothetical protein